MAPNVYAPKGYGLLQGFDLMPGFRIGEMDKEMVGRYDLEQSVQRKLSKAKTAYVRTMQGLTLKISK